MKILRNCSGLTLIETLCAAAVTTIVLACASVGVIALQRSFVGSKFYAAKMNDGSRLTDYVSRDLHSAFRVSRIDSGTTTSFKTGTLEVTDINQLVIFLPNYFVSNIPDNSSGSDYKTPTFSRSRLPAGQTYFPYDDVVSVVGTTRTLKYPGELEVRYLKKARSAQDPTTCYFRQEYEAGTLRLEQEIAEDAETGKLSVLAVSARRFQILTSFGPKWTGEATRLGTRQFSTVQLLNPRRD